VLTGTLPFGKLPEPEVALRILGKERPSKPSNAVKLGLSERVWALLEDCWQTDRTRRPSVKDVSDRVKIAASVCGTLSSVGDAPRRYEDPNSDLTKFGRSLPQSSSGGYFTGLHRSIIPRNALR